MQGDFVRRDNFISPVQSVLERMVKSHVGNDHERQTSLNQD